MFQLTLEKEKVVDTVMRLSLNRLSLRYQKIFKLFCDMVNRLIDLLCETINSFSNIVLVMLQTFFIYFSKEGSCV